MMSPICSSIRLELSQLPIWNLIGITCLCVYRVKVMHPLVQLLVLSWYFSSTLEDKFIASSILCSWHPTASLQIKMLFLFPIRFEILQQTHASDVADFIQKKLKLPPVLLGHSFGGLIIQHYIASIRNKQVLGNIHFLLDLHLSLRWMRCAFRLDAAVQISYPLRQQGDATL